jgi:hypothetical protein
MSERSDELTEQLGGQDFNATVTGTSMAFHLLRKMLALHPNRVNPGSPWATAKAVKRP